MLAASAPPAWHGDLAWAVLSAAFVSALAILADQTLLGYRQEMGVMNLVHPLTALYLGPVWLWTYLRLGRRGSRKWACLEARRIAARGAGAAPRRGGGPRIGPWQVASAVSHCGAGCTLGDIAGEWLVYGFAISWFGTWSGHPLPEELLLDFVLAWGTGIAFQYATMAPTQAGGGRLGALRHAIQVDTASILAFQVGLFGWMAIFMLVLWPHGGISIASPDFWFQMQIGMALGFLTAWPVNRLLIARGVKGAMDDGGLVAEELEQLELRGTA